MRHISSGVYRLGEWLQDVSRRIMRGYQCQDCENVDRPTDGVHVPAIDCDMAGQGIPCDSPERHHPFRKAWWAR